MRQVSVISEGRVFKMPVTEAVALAVLYQFAPLGRGELVQRSRALAAGCLEREEFASLFWLAADARKSVSDAMIQLRAKDYLELSDDAPTEKGSAAGELFGIMFGAALEGDALSTLCRSVAEQKAGPFAA